jgi:hypothetical protein
VKIAYAILAHRGPEQVLRLVSRLSSPSATFVIHIDRYANREVFETVRDGLAGRADARLVRRHGCAWGGFSLVSAALELLEAAATEDPDFVILLSGQDYPIRPVEEIERFLDSRRGTSFVEHFALPNDSWAGGGMERMTGWYWYGRVMGRHVIFPHPRLRTGTWHRRFPRGFTPYGGSAFWALTGEAAKYVLAFTRSQRSFVRYFHHVAFPDESFFQTILLNAPLAAQVVSDSLRYTDWSTTGSSPKTISQADIDRVLASRKLFARKFDDAAMLDAIDDRVHGGRT